jgi:hypothetical protein
MVDWPSRRGWNPAGFVTILTTECTPENQAQTQGRLKNKRHRLPHGRGSVTVCRLPPAACRLLHVLCMTPICDTAVIVT